MNKSQNEFLKKNGILNENKSLFTSPFPQNIEMKIDYILEKVQFYFNSNEFECIIRFLEESVKNFLQTYPHIHFNILFFQLVYLICSDEDISYIEKYYQLRIMEITKLLKNSEQKQENMKIILKNLNFFKKHSFSSNFISKIKEFFLKIEFDLRSYFTNLNSNKKINEISDFSDQDFVDYDEEIINEIKGNDYFLSNSLIKNQFLSYETNFICTQAKCAPKISQIDEKSEKLFNNKKKENKIFSCQIDKIAKFQNFQKPKKIYTDHLENYFLKDFNQKYIKREIIDKKILRKFRNFLKKENNTLKEIDNKEFWLKFSKENLLPPMKYQDSNTSNILEFKSFSIKFMTWIFSQKGAQKLYKLFISKCGEALYKSMITQIKNDEEKQEYEKFLNDLQIYLFDLPKIYLQCPIEIDMPPITPNFEGDVIDSIFGPDIIKNNDNFLSNFRKRPKNSRLECSFDENIGMSELFHNSFSDLNISDSSNDSKNREE